MTLSSPLFLIGLVAVAIPVIVHLFNFRRYRKVYFSNVDYLEQLQTETRRQSRLRQLLILAARILAIVFLVLAFARPVVPNRNNPLKTGSSDVSIYVDNSFSMERTDGSGTLLEKAKTKAREIVSAYGPTDRFQLLTNDAEGRQFHWLSKEEVLVEIDNMELSPVTQTFSSIANRQFDFLHGGSGKNRYAYLISDCQTSVADFANFPNDSSVTAICVPLESKGLNNVFIDSVSLNAPAFSVGSSVAVEVMVRNEGDESLEKVPLTLYVDDKQRALATVDLPAQGTVSTTMHFTLEHGGIVDGRVETTDYPVTFDDKYYFSLNVRDRIRLLVVEGREPNEYLQRLFVGDSVVRYQSLQLQQMDFSRVAENDVVILDELPALTSGMAQTLHSFVEEGGSVVVVAGSKADEGSYNEALRLFAAPRLSGWNGGRVAGGVVNVEHPLYQGVFAGRNDITELPTVTGYHRLAADGTTHRERIITLANGDDYITATSCGSGRLYLIASPLRDANSDFVRQALFVPTLYNMALLSIHPTAPALSLDASAPVPLAGRYGGDGGSVKLRGKDNDYEEIPDVRRMGSGSSLVPHGSIREAGNYHLVVDGEATEGLSFNYSRRESLMQYLSPSAVAQLIKDYHLDHCSVVAQAEKPLDGYLKSQMEGRQLWRWCIVLALLMMLAEIALIRWPERWKTKKNKK